MKKQKYFTIAVALILLVVAVGAVLVLNQLLVLRKAHSTFDNYYAFRGCTQLLEKTDTYGICKTGSGETIKIVALNGKWYLDGDLPWGCVGGICFGW